MGFRSGEYCGRNKNQAPRALSAFAARALLWIGEIIRDHDIAALKGWGELGLDIGVERRR